MTDNTNVSDKITAYPDIRRVGHWRMKTSKLLDQSISKPDLIGSISEVCALYLPCESEYVFIPTWVFDSLSGWQVKDCITHMGFQIWCWLIGCWLLWLEKAPPLLLLVDTFEGVCCGGWEYGLGIHIYANFNLDVCGVVASIE